MVIDDLDILDARIGPAKANAELIVDPDAVLYCPVPLERFQMVSGGNSQVVQASGDLQLPKLSAGHSGDIDKPSDWIPLRQGFRFEAPESSDHVVIVTQNVTIVKN